MVMATSQATATWKATALAQLTAQPLVGPNLMRPINTRLVDAPATPRTLPTVLLNLAFDEWRVAPDACRAWRGGGTVASRRAHLRRSPPHRIGINGERSMEAVAPTLSRLSPKALATADLPFDPDLVREATGNLCPATKPPAADEPQARTDLRSFCASRLMAVGCAYEALHELVSNTGRCRGDGLRRSARGRQKNICIRR